MKVSANLSRQLEGITATVEQRAKALRGSVESPLAGPFYVDRFTDKPPRKMRTGSGAPSICWVCGKQLQRAKGKGLGLFYFNLVRDRANVEHRVHGSPCTQMAIDDGAKVAKERQP